MPPEPSQTRLPRGAAARLGHGGQPHGHVGGAVADIAIFALQDFEEKPVVERLGVDVEQLATVGIPVIQDVVVSQFAQELVV
nr:hypothetical protein [Tanacetum cinerariifolium]